MMMGMGMTVAMKSGLCLVVFCFICIYSAASYIPKQKQEVVWVNASWDFLTKLYTNHDTCFMKAALSYTHAQCPIPVKGSLEARCSAFSIYSGEATQAYGDNNVSFPASMTQVISGITEMYPHITQISDLLMGINQSNRALVLIGDSITRNSIEALMCILQLELSPQFVSISPPLTKVLYNAVHYTITIPKATVHLVYNSIWHPFQSGKGGTTTFIHGELSRYIFNKRYPTMGALVVFNIGIHERGQKMMTKSLNEMFTYARTTLLSDHPERKITFLYRESSVQHYPEPGGLYNRNKAKKWQTGEVPSPVCSAQPAGYTNTAPRFNDNAHHELDWRYRAEINSYKTSKFDMTNIIFFRDFSNNFWDVHPASPFFKRLHYFSKQTRGNHQGRDEDCTHYPAAVSPLLYRLMWQQVLMR